MRLRTKYFLTQAAHIGEEEEMEGVDDRENSNKKAKNDNLC